MPPVEDGADPRTLVHVKSITGITYQLPAKINADSTVLGVKQALFDKERIPVDQQRLIFNGKQLEDGRTLASYNYVPPAALHLVLRSTSS